MARKSLIVACLATFGLVAVVSFGTAGSFPARALTALSASTLDAGALDFRPRSDAGFAELRKAADAAESTSAEAAARTALALALERRALLASAARELRRAAEASRDAGSAEEYVRRHVDLGRVLLQDGDFVAARRALEVASALDASAGPAGYRRADVLLLQGEVEKAAGKYDDAARYLTAAEEAFRALGDAEGLARCLAQECDRLQLQRFVAPAAEKCAQAIKLQPRGHPDRPRTERIFGVVHYFSQSLQAATTHHTNALKALRSAGREDEAAHVREYLIDDQAAVLEMANAGPEAYAPLIAELAQLAGRLEAAPEVQWWRVSDCRLRLADLHRRAKDLAAAEAQMHAARRAFERRPDYAEVPDYATIFEFEALLAKDRSDPRAAAEAFARTRRVLAGIVGEDNLDVKFLDEEIAALGAVEMEA